MSVELTQSQKYLADDLHKTGAFKIGEFYLKHHETNPSAPPSPFKISIRLEEMNGETQNQKKVNFNNLLLDFTNLIYEDTKPLLHSIQHVAGVPNAGTALAEDYAVSTNTPLLILDKIETPSCRAIASTIHGKSKEGDRVLGIDDLVTQAHSKLEFKDALESNGLILAHLALGIDREQGGMERLREAGVSVSASLTITQLLDYYLAQNYLNPSWYDQTRSYIQTSRLDS